MKEEEATKKKWCPFVRVNDKAINGQAMIADCLIKQTAEKARK